MSPLAIWVYSLILAAVIGFNGEMHRQLAKRDRYGWNKRCAEELFRTAFFVLAMGSLAAIALSTVNGTHG